MYQELHDYVTTYESGAWTADEILGNLCIVLLLFAVVGAHTVFSSRRRRMFHDLSRIALRNWAIATVIALISGGILFVATFIVGINAEEKQAEAQEQLQVTTIQELKEKYKIVDADTRKLDWVILDKNDWREPRTKVTVLLESDERATYEIGFDQDSELTLYLPQDTTVPDPETIER